ncbi:hypothetical protein S7711_10987 [Stachybotrys chartarum IBT 7711]|uniref:Transcription factor domain-containing protein n=1 Tax=Stachybotrys chartarum (strain CBS 109288 / IBT 7711) TaxID=1280523 RepID=A0A084AM74_STACB|nr:hypothetical protein S7711_10987 [Stachybotrys chartarum IBT 7711]
MRAAPVGNADIHYMASLAVVIGHLAKAMRDSGMETKAVQLSSRAVAMVQSTLSRGSTADAAGLLAVITALGIYNVKILRSRENAPADLVYNDTQILRSYMLSKRAKLHRFSTQQDDACQLESLLNGSNPEHDIIRSFADFEAIHILRTLQLREEKALLLPEEVVFSWQHGLEGLRILAGFRAALPAGPELYLTFAPIAILYCFSRCLGIEQTMISMISGEAWADDAEEELGPYRLYSFETATSKLSGNVASTAPAEQGSVGNSGTYVARQLFINSAWP